MAHVPHIHVPVSPTGDCTRAENRSSGKGLEGAVKQLR